MEQDQLNFMEQDQQNFSAFLPLTLLSVAFAIIMIFQLSAIIDQGSNMRIAIGANLVNLDREAQMRQAAEQDIQYLANAVIQLAEEGNTNAQQVMQAFSISRQSQAPTAPAQQ